MNELMGGNGINSLNLLDEKHFDEVEKRVTSQMLTVSFKKKTS